MDAVVAATFWFAVEGDTLHIGGIDAGATRSVQTPATYAVRKWTPCRSRLPRARS
jgi:hypothetical protein